jgi:rhodanese-related sulfurtransferase
MDLTQEDWSNRFESDDDALLLDVRTQEEYDDGHIPNATLLDIQQPQSFMDALQELDPSKNYYVYCRSGGRSSQACQLMNKNGIETTYNLLGGFMEWDGDTA